MEQRGRTRQFAAPWNDDERTTARSLLPPLPLLSIAVLLLGVGQVPNNTPQCGVMFVFITLSLGWITLHMAPPDASFVGRYAGAFLIHASSILDTYRWGRLRWEFFHRCTRTTAQNHLHEGGQEIALITIAVIKGGRQ